MRPCDARLRGHLDEPRAVIARGGAADADVTAEVDACTRGTVLEEFGADEVGRETLADAAEVERDLGREGDGAHDRIQRES